MSENLIVEVNDFLEQPVDDIMYKIQLKYIANAERINQGGATVKKITAPDTIELSISERIQLVEDIWDTIALEAEAVELTDHEKILIDERLEAYHRNPDSGAPWGDVYKRILSRQ